MIDIDSREAAINLSVVFFSVFLFFAGFELALQMDLIGDSSEESEGIKFCEGPDDRRIFHSEFGWVEHPNSQFIRSGSNIFTHNEEGFRDTYNKGKENVIVLGDSYAQGYNANQNATFSHLLDRWSDNTSFRNYGMGGYGTDQELMVYRNISERIDHKAVVLTYYLGNDATDNLKQHPRRPEFEVNNGTLNLKRSPQNVSRAKRGNTAEGVIRNPYLDKMQHILGTYTETYSFLVPKLQSIYLSTSSSGWVPEGEELDNELRRTEYLIHNLSKEAERNNASLVIVLVPERAEVYRDEPHLRKRSEGKEYWNVQREMIQGVSSKRNSTTVIDPLEELISKSEEKRVYGKKDAHLSEEGYRVLAKQLYSKLGDQDILIDEEPNFGESYSRNVQGCP